MVRPNVRVCACAIGYAPTTPKEIVGSEKFANCKGSIAMISFFTFPEINPCLNNNGDCEDKCVKRGPGVRTCYCSDNNAVLNLDERTCACDTGYDKNGTKCTGTESPILPSYFARNQ